MSTDVRAALPLPPGFPVTWDPPEDEASFWARDKMHNPNQISVQDFSWFGAFDEGFSAAARAYSLPILGPRGKRINTYLYGTMVPFDGTPEEVEARGAEAQRRMQAAMGSLMDTWNGEHLPELLAHLEHWASFDLAGCSDAELREHLRDTRVRFLRAAEIHFLVVLPAYLAISEFDELHRGMFGSETAFGSYELLQGLPNKTTETGQALWDLSRRALRADGLAELLAQADPSRIREVLAGSDVGRAFASDFEAYLSEYGQRGDLWDLVDPSWIEDPTPVVHTLREYMAKPDDASPAAELRRLAGRREAATARVESELASRPDGERDLYRFLLQAAREGIVLSEDHGFYIDFSCTYHVRRVVLGCGERLVASSVIDAVDDVWLLSFEEVEASLADPASLRDAVAERREEMARFADVDVPDAIGTPPADEPGGSDPFSRFLEKFFGPAEPVSGDGEVVGVPGAPGRARGTARIVASISDADKVQPGDVLVARTTAPPWTPLFAFASAVVTDTGGVLSHCAVVAREYGIPAVVGTHRATQLIADGQTIEVDGDAGVVRIID